MDKATVKFYVDTFGIDNVIVITDNLKTYKNGEGKVMIIDFNKEIVYAISAAMEKSSYNGANLFEMESFEFGEIQFLSSRGDAPELNEYLNALVSQGTITADRRKEIIKFFKETFAFAYGYDRKDPLSPSQPKNKEGKYLTPKDAESLQPGARHPMPYNLNEKKDKDDDTE